MAKNFKTLEEAQAASNKNKVVTIPSEIFVPKKILEWKTYATGVLPYRALNRKDEEVYYIRTATGELIDVGIPKLDDNGDFVYRTTNRTIRCGEVTNLILSKSGNYWITPNNEPPRVIKPAKTKVIVDKELVYKSKMEKHTTLRQAQEIVMSVGLNKFELPDRYITEIEARPGFLGWLLGGSWREAL